MRTRGSQPKWAGVRCGRPDTCYVSRLSVDGIAAFLKPHRIPIFPHVGPHLTPGSGVRWGAGHVFKNSFFVDVLNSINLIQCREKTSE